MGDKEDVRNHLDIVDFISQTVQLKRGGRNFKGLCPFHKEKSPSFTVSPERQTFKCFGCGEGGDIFSYYMKLEGVTFGEALRDLAKTAGVELTQFQPTPEIAFKEKLLEIQKLAAEFYHFLLTKHTLGEKALAYIKERGVTLTQIKDFKIGYAPSGWRSLTDFLVSKKKFKPEDVEKAGLIMRGGHNWYDRFRGRIMFPLSDVRGNTVGFSGRILPWTDDGKSGKYINSPETPIYHKSQLLFPLFQVKDEIRKKNSVVIVEGEFDALASLRANVSNVVAVKGSALTEDQVKLMQRFCDTAILALDADDAGIKAAKRAIGIASQAEMNIRVVELSQGKDPDELVKTDPKKWREAVKKAVGVYDFFLDIAKRNHDTSTVEGQQAISKELVPLLNQIQNQIVQAHYIKQLSSLLGIETTVVEREMERQQKKSYLTFRPSTPKKKEETSVSRTSMLLEEILTFVIHYYNDIDLGTVPLDDFPDTAVTKVVSALRKEKPKEVVAFASTLPPELQQAFDACFMKEVESMEGTKAQEKLSKLVSEVAKFSLRDKLTRLRNQVKNTSSSDEREQLKHQINDVLVRFRGYSK